MAKLVLALAAGSLLFGIAYALGRAIERPPLDVRSLIWSFRGSLA